MSLFFAFPGQGAQVPGMLSGLPDAAPIRATLEEAADLLKTPVATLDTAQALTSTRTVQLCLLIAGVAAARLLAERGHQPTLVAGLSIGAYPAAVTAGALSFADALHLVALRGELMQQAYPSGYGMSAITGLTQAQLEPLLAELHTTTQPLYLANLNAERQLIVAGRDTALVALEPHARAAGASAIRRLNISVPSHCPLLDTPAHHLAAAFATISLQPPRLTWLSSTRARPLRDPAAIADDLAFNMARQVHWQATIQSARERGARLHLELPPGRVLTHLARPIFAIAAIAFDGTRLDTLDALLFEAAS